MKRHVWWLLAATGFLLLETGTAAASGRADPALADDAQVLQEDAWDRTVSGVRFITPAGWNAET